jgi:hypothetical protein
MEFAWTLCLLAMCGGTIFHRNIWSFSKCSEKSKSIASYHNFIFYFQILTNLVQVITECRSCFKLAPGSPRPPSAPSCPRTHFRSAPEILSAPRDSTRSLAVCGSHPKLSAPMPVLACARSCSGWRLIGFCEQPPSYCQPPCRRATVRKVTAIK